VSKKSAKTRLRFRHFAHPAHPVSAASPTPSRRGRSCRTTSA
jgi:hypothetical protein